MEQVTGYKEWEAVCAALGEGRQVVLLRKGGIHEGRAGFSFRNERFFLFPTRFHAQGEQIRVPWPATAGEWEAGDEVPIRYWCESQWAITLQDWELVRQLEPYHVWTEEVVRERFDCGEDQQIHCALVRVHRLADSWSLDYAKKFGGCRTWVDLPEPPQDWATRMSPVVPEDEFRARCEEIEALVRPESKS